MSLSFKVEDGSGLADATSYVSVEYAEALFFGFTGWTGKTTAQKQEALIYATTLIDFTFDFKGTVLNSLQRLKMPTSEVSINSNVQKAVCYIAYDYLVNSNNMLTKTAEVDISSISITDFSVSVNSSQKYPLLMTKAYALLDPYIILKGSSTTKQIIIC